MDQSWRMRMGMPDLPRRRSTEEPSSRCVTETVLDADDFSDVFGGPPRSVLSRKFSRAFCARSTSSSSGKSFYEDVLRHPESESKSSTGGRRLPKFRIPSRHDEFYGDVFRGEDDQRMSRERSRSDSKAKSKSNSSSVLSSEELSPLRPALGDDVALNSFASKLSPINVPGRWNSAIKMPEDKPNKQAMPVFQCNPPSAMENQYMESESNNFRSPYYGFSRRNSSPETISVDPNSYGSFKVSGDDVELNSPSSPVSSLCQETETEATRVRYDNFAMPVQEMDQEEDEVMSSYVIEINSDHREKTGEAVSVDEAIAWARERFQRQSTERQGGKDQSTELGEKLGANGYLDQEMNGHEMEEQKKWTANEEKEQSDKDQLRMEMDLLDEDVRLWSAGKETNIQSLLSTLHHILWPSSGWYPITFTSLTESTHVKKAYQRARLCLHPDKLQQRGATVQQKYVAEKAFSILQDAWATFISQDVFFNQQTEAWGFSGVLS